MDNQEFYPTLPNIDLRDEFERLLNGDVGVVGIGRPVILRRVSNEKCACWDDKSGGPIAYCSYCMGEGFKDQVFRCAGGRRGPSSLPPETAQCAASAAAAAALRSVRGWSNKGLDCGSDFGLRTGGLDRLAACADLHSAAPDQGRGG